MSTSVSYVTYSYARFYHWGELGKGHTGSLPHFLTACESTIILNKNLIPKVSGIKIKNNIRGMV